jgi:hypothetical protein
MCQLLACGDKIASGEDHTGDTDSDADTDTGKLFNFYMVVER